MAPSTHRVKFTYEDYVLFPQDGKRHELIDGDHYMTPAPDLKHQAVSSNLHRLLGMHIHAMRLGHLFAAPTDVVLSDQDIVQPDLLFVSTAHSSILTPTHVHGAPDLVVEILSESTRRTDEIVKRKLYERYGVPEYWIVDPELGTVKIYRMADNGYVRATELSQEADDILTTPLLPNLQIALPQLFE